MNTITVSFTTRDVNKNDVPFNDGPVKIALVGQSDKEPLPLYRGYPNPKGQVRTSVPIAKSVKLAIEAKDLDGNELIAKVWEVAGKDMLEIRLDTAAVRQRVEAPIENGKQILGVGLRKNVASRLKERKLTSLAALRSGAEGLLVNLDEMDRKELEGLQAHARLQLFSRQHALNARMINAGITSAEMVARLSPSEFLKNVNATEKEMQIWRGVWNGALSLTAMATTTYVQGKVDVANGRPTNAAKMYLSTSGDAKQPCQCSCASAVSPLAYLADLLDFAVRNVRRNGNAVSMEALNDAFCQPFKTLATNCTASETLVRQVRLCIETLRRKAVADAVDVQAALRAHEQRTYEALLNELGVPYSDLRSARTSSDARKQALADRLGVAVADLEQFTLFPASQGLPANRTVSEANIESLFGLPATDPDRAVPTSSVLRVKRQAALSAQWQEADDATTSPLVDPDIVDRSWFASGAGSDNPWEALFLERNDELDTLLQEIRTTVVDQASLERVLVTASNAVVAGLTDTLGIGLQDTARLDALNTARKEGRSYSNADGTPLDLAGHYLTRARLDRLLAIRDLAAASDSVPADWDEVAAILTAIDKEQRLFATWKTEEVAAISVDPRWLLMPTPLLKYAAPAESTPAFVTWRFDTSRRRTLLDALSTRIEQSESLSNSLSTTVDKAEEVVLERLRDDLLLKVVPNLVTPGGVVDAASQLEHVRRWATNNLLINAYESSCRKTTRVAQGIEALQLLLWGVHSGLIEDASWKIGSRNFVDEWRWMGSYAAWRSAMWVFIYPENMLMPHTRRRISLPFAALVQAAGLSVDGSHIQVPADGDTMTEAPRSDRGDQSAIDTILAGFVEVAGAKDGPLQDFVSARDSQDFTMARLIYRFRLRKRLSAMIKESSTNDDGEEVVSPLKFQGSGEDHRAQFFRDERYLWLPLFVHDHAMRNGWYDLALRAMYYLVDPVSGALRDHVRDLIGDLQGSPVPILLPPQPYAGEGQVDAQTAWLQDPLDPHRIADVRSGTHERSIMLRWASCLTSYADAEFARDTSESVAKARELYLKAQQVLAGDVLGQHSDSCRSLRITVGTEKWKEIELVLDQVLVEVGAGFEPRVDDHIRDELKREITGLMDTGRIKKGAGLRQQLRVLVSNALKPKPALTLVERNKASAGVRVQYMQAQQQAVGNPVYSMAIAETDEFDATYDPAKSTLVGMSGSIWMVTMPPSFTYCIPPNPVIGLLRLSATVGMHKLNNCMNAAGLKREVPSYSAPTDVTSGVPASALIGTVQAPSPSSAPPTQYRYRILVERARQLQGYAQQLETTYFSYLLGNDNERYSMMQAQQGLGISKANVRLQDLRKTEAEDQYALAEMQWNRVDFIRSHYAGLVENGQLSSEAVALQSLQFASLAYSLGISAVAATGDVGGAVNAAGQALSMIASFNTQYAAFERRNQEWEFQRDLAQLHDLVIADQQKVIADDHVNIVDQEWRTANLSMENATDVVEFLNSKFTSQELFAWMVGVVGGVYRYMLQQACSMAKSAQRQLAFERQEPESGFILGDYWDYSDASGAAGSTDRKGMTGAERLLGDLTKLDQHAFLTEKRRLNLSKTISLAHMGPMDFEKFRETGVLPISLNQELFDRDFPGHYLRLIRRIRVSVFALVPPAEGIRASLFSTGISKVVRGGSNFEELSITNSPEIVALTSPLNASGVFELEQQPEMLLPFEGMGVEASWVFEMPRPANPIDYSTIADVLFTVEYTALPSDQRKHDLVQIMNQDRSVEGNRLFSFRHHFADAWYDLNHPELQDPGRQMKVEVEVRNRDFPPNILLDTLKLKHVTLMFVRKDGGTTEVLVKGLQLKLNNAAGTTFGPVNDLTSVNGLLSTRQLPGTAWTGTFADKPPAGLWSLELAQAAGAGPIADAFKNGEITDVLMVLTFRGETPPWPA